MQNKQIKQLIENVLKVDARLWDEDGELDAILLLHLVDKTDANIITLLLEVEELRDKFFIKISDAYVFKSNEFRFFIEENRINNSYTSYKNKIGLALRDKFLSNNDEVVLNFPYKDCVLEGGQSSEDMVDLAFKYSAHSCEYEEVKDKKGKKEKPQRREVFFNQIIGADEIDRLFDEKAFTNFVRYNQDGADTPHEFNRNADGVITDNLIIKGNNLLALHSIKRQFAGRVKLIYIDPPYNTGNDGFKYNDNFNHSTWLTFMKNRLEVAKELLRDDGVIFVQIDDNEQAYLKVLMDEIFGREQVDCIVWQKMDARYDKNTNAKVINRYKEIHEYILIGYKKDKKEYLFNKIKKLPDWKNEQSNPDNDKRGKYKQGIISFLEGHENEDKNSEFYYSITLPSGRVMTRHFFITKEEFERLRADNRIYFPNNGDGVPAKKIFEDEEQEYKMDSILRGFGTTSTAKDEIFDLFGDRDLFATPKPEKLLAELIRLSTKPGDIVLDYHLGSGTTAAVAHKMGRQYIGIEQMDYIESIAVTRLKKVIGGEMGGVSKNQNWGGGGEFIYFELAKHNESAKDIINACNSLDELKEVFAIMCDKYFLDYHLRVKEFREQIIYEEEFKNLALDKQKHMFIAMLDQNQLYVNYTEMADSKYNLNTEDQHLTELFYN